VSVVYCPEGGLQDPEAANYCSRCGAWLVKDEVGAALLAVVGAVGVDEAAFGTVNGHGLYLGCR